MEEKKMLKSKKFIMITVLAMIMMFAGVTSAFAASEVESNNTKATANLVIIGSSTWGTISSSSDMDQFVFVANSAKTRISFLPPSNSVTYSFYVYEYNSESIVAYGLSGGPGVSQTNEFVTTPQGVYVVLVFANGASSSLYQFGLYDV